jgi:uncharacterized membrane protein YtjA (UPF0391 family)
MKSHRHRLGASTEAGIAGCGDGASPGSGKFGGLKEAGDDRLRGVGPSPSAVRRTLAMLRLPFSLGITYLVLALISAPFGFGALPGYSWWWAKPLFFAFLALAALAFAGGAWSWCSGGRRAATVEAAARQPGVRAGMEAVGSCGGHVGFVDAVEDDVTIRLRRRDEGAAGVHHYIPMDWVGSVGEVVRLNKTRAEARRQWHLEPFASSR